MVVLLTGLGPVAAEVVAHRTASAVAGFTLLGSAVATIAPFSSSAAGALAGSSDPAKVDQVVAHFNQFNDVGALLGAVLTGAVGAENLRIGFAVPMVLIPLAGQFSVIRDRVRR